MNKITQYRPAFFDGFKNDVVSFNMKKELLEIPFVKNFSNDDDFSHYAISKNLLMCVCCGGMEWWVIGALEHPELLDIPAMVFPPTEIKEEYMRIKSIENDLKNGVVRNDEARLARIAAIMRANGVIE